MPYIDVKVTAWERLEYDNSADINKLIEVYHQYGVGDLFQSELGYWNFDVLLDTVEEIPDSSENNGDPVIEFYDDSGNLIHAE